MSDTLQIRCPTCNAAQVKSPTGNYLCDCCLSPFSVVEAAREATRMREADSGWLEQKVGAAGLGGSAVDASSRAFIFRQRLLPDLQRDVDRALEQFGTYGQFPLVVPPVPVAAPKGAGVNPLVVQRARILELRGIRGRLGNEQVSAFAVGHADRAALQALERRLADIMQLSNVADAAARRDGLGYVSARRNLEILLEEVSQSVALEGAQDAALGAFLGGLSERYYSLVELARVCEELASPNALSGAAMADRVADIGERLTATARRIETLEYSPADTMPVVVGVDQEATACRSLVRWLRAYDAIAGRSQHAFGTFVAEMDAGYTHTAATPDAKLDLLDGCAQVLRAVHGEVAVAVLSDFAWVPGWAEAGRAKKTWGLFGTEEAVLDVRQFLVPVWVADISFSASTGAVFKEGVEGRCVAIVDACTPDPARVRFLDPSARALQDAMGQLGQLGTTDVALPRSTAASVHGVFLQAVRARPTMLNAKVQVRTLGFLPAAQARFGSDKGERAATACLAGSVQIGDAARVQVDATQQMLQRFG